VAERFIGIDGKLAELSVTKPYEIQLKHRELVLAYRDTLRRLKERLFMWDGEPTQDEDRIRIEKLERDIRQLEDVMRLYKIKPLIASPTWDEYELPLEIGEFGIEPR